jgi:hypothetical protein
MPIIPGTWEMEIRKITIPGQHRQNVSEPHPASQPISQAWWYVPIIPATREIKVEGSLSRG